MEGPQWDASQPVPVCTTDEVRRLYEQPFLDTQKVNFLFWAVLQVMERLDARVQNEKLVVSALDRLSAKIGNLDLHNREDAKQAHTDQQRTHQDLADLGAALEPVQQLIRLVSLEVLKSDQYSVQAVEHLNRLTTEIRSLPPMIRSALELSLSSASLEEPAPAPPPPPSPLVLVSKAVAA